MFNVLQGFTNFYFLKFIKVLHILTVPIIALCWIALIISLDSFLLKLSEVIMQVLWYDDKCSNNNSDCPSCLNQKLGDWILNDMTKPAASHGRTTKKVFEM